MEDSIKHKVLIIDDHVVMREVVADILAFEDYEVFMLECTVKAMNVLEDKGISLLLLDVNLPGESGYDFILRMKKNEACKDIPVIFMTGLDNIDDKIYGFELGAVDYIVKPFHRMDVLMRVKAHLKLVEIHKKQKNKLQQISKAHTAQMKKPEDLPRARFGIFFESLEEAGGDFYDVIELEQVGSYAYFIADISGHDIATSYVMPAVRPLLLELLKGKEEFLIRLKRFNLSVCEFLPSGKFITAQLLIVNRSEGRAELVNMGHTPLIYLKSGDKAEVIECPGDILGIHPDPKFGFKEFKINPYDRFVMYSDGLLESYESRRVWTERLELFRDKVAELAVDDVKVLGQRLVSSMVNENDISDDIVVISIEV
ncbi:MAG: fused response regulator/phosphatase [Lentisphaerales bacterium]|nr:fused response regulator/phosphatase [Lentisphaerales bacterium]